MDQWLTIPTRIHEDTGLIPGLTQWPGIQCWWGCGVGPQQQLWFRPLAWTLPYIARAALKRKKQKKKRKKERNQRLTSLLYHTTIHWFCSGNILFQYFEPRRKIEIFLNQNPHPQPLLSGIEQVWKLAFPVDLICFKNKFNIKLQSKATLNAVVKSF